MAEAAEARVGEIESDKKNNMTNKLIDIYITLSPTPFILDSSVHICDY